MHLRFLRVALISIASFLSSDCALASGPMTVVQFEQAVDAALAAGKSDDQLARELTHISLTERLRQSQVSKVAAKAPGPKTLEQIVRLADLSAFLRPPTSDIPDLAAPDQATQRRILSLTVNYVSHTIHMLPDFVSARITTSFQGTDSSDIHKTGLLRKMITYRHGQELIDWKPEEGTETKGLVSWGEFGPVIASTLMDAARSTLTWDRWELGDSGKTAVFHYSVQREKSHYEMHYCCFTYGYHQLVGYSGEISVDPDSGAVLRLSLVADLKAGDPVFKAETVIEYGSVALGGRQYICPLHAVSLSGSNDVDSTHSPIKTHRLEILNDVTFDEYQTKDTADLP